VTDLTRLRSDLRAFSRAIEQPLTDWQAESLTLQRLTTAVVAPRQSGKSRSLSVLALWWAYSRPDQRVLVISAGEDASRRLPAQAAEVATRSPLLVGSVVDENSGLLAPSNGSEIRSVPASERVVHGWTVDLLLVDEAAHVPEDRRRRSGWGVLDRCTEIGANLRAEAWWTAREGLRDAQVDLDRSRRPRRQHDLIVAFARSG
jgi:hypothetical protein